MKNTDMSPRMSLITNVNVVANESQLVVPTENSDANDHFHGKLKAKIRKCIAIFPATHIIDFMAVWIHFFLFLTFNYIYWTTY